MFIPWSDVERIVIYSGPKARESGARDRLSIGIQRRPGAPRLPHGNGPARRCPVPGLTEGTTRQVVAWRLDRERLAALTAAVAPGIPVIDADADAEGAAVEDANIEGAAIEGAPSEGASIEGAAIEGAAIEGAAIKGAAVERCFEGRSRLAGDGVEDRLSVFGAPSEPTMPGPILFIM